MKIGIAREYLDGVRDDVKEAVLEAAKVYESLGAEIVYFDLPILKFALPVYYIIACAEASSTCCGARPITTSRTRRRYTSWATDSRRRT